MEPAHRPPQRPRGLREGLHPRLLGRPPRLIALLLITLLLVALLLAAPAAAQRPGLDPGAGRRVPVPATEPPWSSIVLVQAPGLARCTGFVAAPGQVVTAAHCLFSRRLARFIPPGALHVLAGYAGGRFAAHARVATYRVAPGYDPADSRGTGADIALLTLAAPLASPALPLVPTTPHTLVALAGFNQDRAQILMADPACQLAGHAADPAGRPLLVHGCEATLGTSGAPLLARAADGTWQVVGLHVAARRTGPGGLAIPASAIAALR